MNVDSRNTKKAVKVLDLQVVDMPTKPPVTAKPTAKKMTMAGDQAWTDAERATLLVLAAKEKDAETLVKKHNKATGANRTANAIYGVLKNEDAANHNINGVILRSFSALHNSVYLPPVDSTDAWLPIGKAVEYVGKSATFIALKVRLGQVERRQTDSGFEYKRDDLAKFRVITTSEQDSELAARIKSMVSLRSEKAKPIAPPPYLNKQLKKNSWTAQLIVEDITPKRALEMLESSSGNRTVANRTVAAYAKEMLAGQWGESSTTISVDWNGHVINGHHRLYAIIASGKTIRCYVMYNIAPESFVNDDRVRPRTPWQSLSDLFRKEISAWANISMRGLYKSTRQLTLRELMTYAEKHKAAIEWAKQFGGRRDIFSKMYVSGALVAAYYLDPKKVDEFTRQLISNEGLRKGMPAHTARAYLDSGDKPKREVAMLKLARCVIAHIDGEELSPKHLLASDATVARLIAAQPRGSVLSAKD